MKLIALGQGSGGAGYGASGIDTYGGPDYPRITRNDDGTTTVEVFPGYVGVARTRHAETQRGGERPGVYPGVVDGRRRWYPVPGTSMPMSSPDYPQGFRPPSIPDLKTTFRNYEWIELPDAVRAQLEAHATEGTEPFPVWDPLAAEWADIGLRRRTWSGELVWSDGNRVERRDVPYSGGACFYGNPPLQGPCPGDPDYGVVSPGTGGYELGTPSKPYAPWLDPANPWYGHYLVGPPAPVAVPEPWDPWEEIPPEVDFPGAPDPEDEDVWVLPPEDPAPLEPIPCIMVGTGAVGTIDPITGECVDDAGEPLPPYIPPDVPPPDVDPAPGPPAGPTAPEPSRGAVMAALAAGALFLLGRRR